jgi:hypothetical protein
MGCGVGDPPNAKTIYKKIKCLLIPVLWIRIGFIADPDPGSRTNADRSGFFILVRLCLHKKLNFYIKNILSVG